MESGARALVHALQTPSCPLTTLKLGTNRIGDVGARALAHALQTPSCRLTTLKLGFNRIGDVGARALAHALESESCRITHLHFSCNEISDDVKLQIKDALKRIKRMIVAKREIRDLGVVEVMSMVDCDVSSQHFFWNHQLFERQLL